MQPHKTLGVILAGGQSSRMGCEKSLILLAGRPVLAHVIGRFARQTDLLALNANGDAGRFADFDLPVFADDANFINAGPLAGVLAGLEYGARAGCTHVVTVPCDAPFLPLDLVLQLRNGGSAENILCARSARGPEPLHALWPVAAMTEIRQFLAGGHRKVLDFIVGCLHAQVDISQSAGEPDAFLNLNRPQDIEQAHVTMRATG